MCISSIQLPASSIQIVAEFVLFPFRSPLLREYLLVSFPLGTEMFHFPRSALLIRYDESCMGLPYRVAPFGNLRIAGCLAPPRSLSQPNHVLHRLLQSRHPPHALTQNSRKELREPRIFDSSLFVFWHRCQRRQ